LFDRYTHKQCGRSRDKHSRRETELEINAEERRLFEKYTQKKNCCSRDTHRRKAAVREIDTEEGWVNER